MRQNWCSNVHVHESSRLSRYQAWESNRSQLRTKRQLNHPWRLIGRGTFLDIYIVFVVRRLPSSSWTIEASSFFFAWVRAPGRRVHRLCDALLSRGVA